jgi:hypothetical protein
MREFAHEEKFIIIHCVDCHMAFAVTEDFSKKRIQDHKLFFCPTGHEQYYPHESDIEKANRWAREAQEKAICLQQCVDHKREVIRKKEYQVRHYKGEVTKLKKVKK